MKKKIGISCDLFPTLYYSPAKLCIYIDMYIYTEIEQYECSHRDTNLPKTVRINNSR